MNGLCTGLQTPSVKSIGNMEQDSKLLLVFALDCIILKIFTDYPGVHVFNRFRILKFHLQYVGRGNGTNKSIACSSRSFSLKFITNQQSSYTHILMTWNVTISSSIATGADNSLDRQVDLSDQQVSLL